MPKGVMHKRGVRCEDCRTKAPCGPFRNRQYFFWYMVTNDLWDQAMGTADGIGMLCIRCLRARIGRDLTEADFPRKFTINTFAHLKARYANGDDHALDRAVGHKEKC